MPYTDSKTNEDENENENENELFDSEGEAMLKVIDDFHVTYLERKKRREMLEAIAEQKRKIAEQKREIAEQKRKLESDFDAEIRFLAAVSVRVPPTIYKPAYITRAGIFVREHYARPPGWQKIDQRNSELTIQTKRRLLTIHKQLMRLEAQN